MTTRGTNRLSTSNQRPINKVPRWNPSGFETLKPAKLNAMVDAINAIITSVNNPKQINPEHFQIRVRRFKIVSVRDDYLYCNPTDNKTVIEDEFFKVAKPYLLQRTPFDGAGKERDGVGFVYSDSQTRVATKAPDSETQIMIPTYLKDDFIYGLLHVTGGVDTDLTQSTIEDGLIEYVDLNLDGRYWSEES